MNPQALRRNSDHEPELQVQFLIQLTRDCGAEAGDRTQDAIRDTGFGDESTAPLIVGSTTATAALEPTPAAARS